MCRHYTSALASAFMIVAISMKVTLNAVLATANIISASALCKGNGDDECSNGNESVNRVDADSPGAMRYDGHGGLSAGASSRLLYDYGEPYRSDILDYLFKPNHGASLDMIKVEIGGDSQSTDGTEASHKHSRDDLDCNRGYEWWLLEQARSRNPDIVTYALSWAVPKWVGNDHYYSKDNIDYHLSWLKCARDEHPGIGKIDYIGAWNERSWGDTEWIIRFRGAMNNEGFNETRIIIPDGSWDEKILGDIDKDGQFKEALTGGGIGLHYPCDDPHPEVQQKYGLKFWSSEDYSTVGDWNGASCWGRLLNQNFVRMNMTSTIAWSLVWSVYGDWPYFGNGLMYAMQPWSGYYEVNQAIWTSAHHTQFMDPGWEYVGGGRGILSKGGSWLSVMSSDEEKLPQENAAIRNVSIIIEKLHGNCLRCAGETTEAEEFTFFLSPSLRHSTLRVWKTNATVSFARLSDVPVEKSSGKVTIHLEPDSIYSLTSLNNIAKGRAEAAIPKASVFPLPYSDKFENRAPSTFPRYFSDNGGSFEIAGGENDNQYLLQSVPSPPIQNAWLLDVEPITILGDNTSDWDMVRVYVSVRIPVHSVDTFRQNPSHRVYAGACLHVQGGGYTMAYAGFRGHCMQVEYAAERGEFFWSLTEGNRTLLLGKIPDNSSFSGDELEWHNIGVSFESSILTGWIGKEQKVGAVNVTNGSLTTGRVGLVSGWNKAHFDNFIVDKVSK